MVSPEIWLNLRKVDFMYGEETDILPGKTPEFSSLFAGRQVFFISSSNLFELCISESDYLDYGALRTRWPQQTSRDEPSSAEDSLKSRFIQATRGLSVASQ